uniref:RxLR effector candidate protein n=1 Tax=Hyaloperonospora arabidopsidis (strain Emoy2) TaxID=559515 RepID=M4B5N9_HYAAE
MKWLGHVDQYRDRKNVFSDKDKLDLLIGKRNIQKLVKALHSLYDNPAWKQRADTLTKAVVVVYLETLHLVLRV